MPTATQEILDKALKDVSALACAGKPDMRAIKEGLLRCIVAADCVEIDNELIISAITTHSRNEILDFSERLCRSNERINLLLAEREVIKGLLLTIHTQASEALADNLEAIPMPEYQATAQVRYFADILRAIGSAAKGIYDSYTGGSVQETDGRIC